ncbi:hypothetical protein [Streptomyces adelaidensis]|uniref:hypothetical protein n=1 Tax=Streptomyces adelaidensis TaxID=2796465 RepID=UPI00190477B4|nr:hypothetical protein [Streptomyces adelaidensis]
MTQRQAKRVPQPVTALLPALVLALVTSAAWAGWLGWDQHRDVQPDGSVTGPYEAWQVIGLVLTLLAPVYWAASRNHIAGAVVGVTAGLTAASLYDWSDDASGLYGVGVTMIMLGGIAVTTGVSFVIAALQREVPPVVPPAVAAE